jgi:hypothetical protein
MVRGNQLYELHLEQTDGSLPATVIPADKKLSGITSTEAIRGSVVLRKSILCAYLSSLDFA